MKDIIVYTSNTCGYCHRLKDYLKDRHIPYTEKNISTDTTARRELVEKGYMGVPIVLAGDETIVGFDKAKLDEIL